jgi:hypothetical protein
MTREPNSACDSQHGMRRRNKVDYSATETSNKIWTMNISTPVTHRLDCMPHKRVRDIAANARRSNGMLKTFFK